MNADHRYIILSGSFFTGASNLTLTGGEFYSVGGNLTIQRTGKSITSKTLYQEWHGELWYRSPRNRWDGSCMRCMCFLLPNRKSESVENKLQMEVHAQLNDRRLEEMMGRSQLPRTISVGLVYIMDATGRQHELTMNMARSFEVWICIEIYYNPSYLLDCAAIQQSTSNPVRIRVTSR